MCFFDKKTIGYWENTEKKYFVQLQWIVLIRNSVHLNETLKKYANVYFFQWVSWSWVSMRWLYVFIRARFNIQKESIVIMSFYLFVTSELFQFVFFSYTQNKLYLLLIFQRETSTFLNEVTNVDDTILFKNQKVNISTLHEQETSFRNNLREAIYHTLTQLTNAHFYYFIFIMSKWNTLQSQDQVK